MDTRLTTVRLIPPNEPGDEPLFGRRPRFFIPVAKPTFTWIVLGLNIAVFIITVLYGVVEFGNQNFLSNVLPTLILFGAKDNQLIAQGQVWRLFTATFLHADILHLLFNLYALSALGHHVEGYLGHGRFLIIYGLAGLWGSLASYAVSPEISVGASGAIFGLAGATAIFFGRYRENFGDAGGAILRNILVVIALNLVFGFTNSQIDNAGHIGGLIGGALVTLGLLPSYHAPDTVQIGNQPLRKTHNLPLEVAWTAAHLVFLWFAVEFVSRNFLS